MVETGLRSAEAWLRNLSSHFRANSAVGPSDQDELRRFSRSTIPAIGALRAKAEESGYAGVGFLSSVGKYDLKIWNTISRARILIIPSAEGVNPTRGHYLRAGATAVLVNDVIKSIFKDRDDKHLHLTQE
jgi:hypothetical protein